MTAGAGLYLHLPFCRSICPYCDFYVLLGGAAERRAFVGRLKREIELWSDWPLPFDTVYLGGGTPSQLEPELIAELLAEVRQRLPVMDGAILHLEANPEDATPEALAAWRQLGVSFLSLGVQSFERRSLELLGRAHDARQAQEAAQAALEAGFATVSLDLIYGLPGQEQSAWRRDLEQAVALGVHHLSCYQLTVHKGTPFGFRKLRGRLTELPEGLQEEMFFLTHRALERAGYPAYEVSSFALAPEHRSRHNRKYWRHLPYLGLGPSAHSFRGRGRWWNLRKIKPWTERLEAGERPVESEEKLSHQQLAVEGVMLGLRTPEGVDLVGIRERFGVDLAAANAGTLENLERRGLARVEGQRLRPTLAGMALADSIAVELDFPPSG